MKHLITIPLHLAAACLASLSSLASAQSYSLIHESSLSNSLGESVVFDPFTYSVFGNGAAGIEYSGLDSGLQFTGTANNIDVETYVNSNIAGFQFSGVSSVAVDPSNRGFGAAAVINTSGSGSGLGAIVFFNTTTKAIIGHQVVGYHPDMVTFSPNGNHILVANESDNAVSNGDSLPGSISNINVSSVTGALDFSGISTTTVDFSSVSTALLTGVRDHGAAMNRNNGLLSDTVPDLNRIEPEYIAVSGNHAYVTLQEANAVAVFDISANTWTDIHKLAPKLQVMDPQNNSTIAFTGTIATLAMPDAIATFTTGSNTYYVTANEGDYRDNNADRKNGSAFTIGTGVGQIDPAYDAALDALYGGNWQASAALGGTRFLSNVGDLDGDGDIDQLTIAGSRSMAIYDAANGNLLFDTNDLAGFGGFEHWIAANDPTAFNIDQAGTTIDVRSRDKGPEPEAIAIGEWDGDLFALVGMERTNHLFLFRLVENVGTATSFNPGDVQFLDAIRWAGEHGPETINFVSASKSPNGKPFFLVGSEISNTWAVYSVPEPASGLLLLIGAGALHFRRRRK